MALSTVSQRSVRDDRQKGVVGRVSRSSLNNLSIFAVNANPQKTQKNTVTVDTASNDTAYTYTVNSVNVTITSDSSATKKEIADALAVQHNSLPEIRGQVKATSDGVDTVTLESTFPGLEFTLSESDSNLSTASTQTADEADPIDFGRLVIEDGMDEGVFKAKLPLASDLTAKSYTFTPDVIANNARYSITLRTTDGDVVDIEFTSSGAATAKEVVEGLKSAHDGESDLSNHTVATEDDSTLTIAAATAGHDFELVAYGHRLDASLTQGDLLSKKALGVSMATSAEEQVSGSSNSQYPGNAGLEVLREGAIWVADDSGTSVSYGDPVYVGMDAGNEGKIYGAIGANRAFLGNAKQLREGGDGLAEIELNLR